MSKDKGYERHNQIPGTKCLMAVDIRGTKNQYPLLSAESPHALEPYNLYNRMSPSNISAYQHTCWSIYRYVITAYPHNHMAACLIGNLTHLRDCWSWWKRIVVSFVLDGRIDGRIDGMVSGYAFPLFRVRRYAGRRGLRMKERSMSVADDRMIERVLLFLYRLMFG